MVQDLNASFRLARLVVFGVSSLFAILVLCLGASITNWTTSRIGGYFSFAALAIAVGILTLFSLPPLLWISMTRKTAVASMIAVELAWIWFLWIMWLALAGSAASESWLSSCGWFDGTAESVCQQTQALTAFAFITWFILLAYAIGFVFLVIRQHTRGNSQVWTGYVLETDYTALGQQAPSGGKNFETGGAQA